MWNLGNEHGQYIISVTFIASATKKAELVSSSTKNVHFRIRAVQKALLVVPIIKSTFQGHLTCFAMSLYYMYVSGAYVLGFGQVSLFFFFFGTYQYWVDFFLVENVLSFSDFRFCTKSKEILNYVKQ